MQIYDISHISKTAKTNQHKISTHNKSKMADGCDSENQHIAMSRWKIIWFWRNLVRNSIYSTHLQLCNQNWNFFLNSRLRTAAILKIVFPARCYAWARPMLSCSVCVSVCPSVTFVSCVKKNKDIFEICSPLGSHTILVFPYQMGWRYSDGNPSNGGVECRWGRQKKEFLDEYMASLHTGLQCY